MNIMNLIKEKSTNLYGTKPVTIAFLGDSVTQGCFEVYKTGEKSIETVFDSEFAYHSYLKKVLAMLYPSVPVNIINAGLSGASATNGLERLKRDVLDFNPDLVVVCFGLNDCLGGIEKIPNYTDALEKIFKTLKEKNIEIIFMTPNMMNTDVSCHIQDEFIKEIANTTMMLQNTNVLEKYLDSAKEMCKNNDIVVCDCYEEWKILAKNGVNISNLFANNINHPKREMHWLFALSLLRTMMEK